MHECWHTIHGTIRQIRNSIFTSVPWPRCMFDLSWKWILKRDTGIIIWSSVILLWRRYPPRIHKYTIMLMNISSFDACLNYNSLHWAILIIAFLLHIGEDFFCASATDFPVKFRSVCRILVPSFVGHEVISSHKKLLHKLLYIRYQI